MVTYDKDKWSSFFRFLPKGQVNLTWLTRYAAIEIAILLAAAIAFYFLGRHLFDLSIPTTGDVRAHIFKIEIFQSYLADFSWPQWVPYWYQGTPINQYYPPGFYFIGAAAAFVFGSSAVAYKILLLLALVLNGLAMYYFARRFLKFEPHVAIWCLIAYETSTPLLVDFAYGQGPNLLAWSISLFFLGFYFSHIVENKTRGWTNIAVPGLLLGLTILVHPFPAIFAILAVCLFHIVRLLHGQSFKAFLHSGLPYLAAVFGMAAVIGMYYWLPAFLTLDYSSGIHSFVENAWPKGGIFLFVIFALALIIGIITRIKTRDGQVEILDYRRITPHLSPLPQGARKLEKGAMTVNKTGLKLDFLILGLVISLLLGFGATNYLPFSLGSLVQSFRFATMALPFFAILLMAFPLNFHPAFPSLRQMVTALGGGFLIIALALMMDNREALLSYWQSGLLATPGRIYQVFTDDIFRTFPSLMSSFLLCIVVLVSLAIFISFKSAQPLKNKAAFVIAGGLCLVMTTSFIPYVNTNQFDLGVMYSRITNYLGAEYAQIMEPVRGSRMVIPISDGGLMEGDSFVTYGRRWGVETVNGPYNQGDPKFFRFTVHVEWENRWLREYTTRENLMQESGAKFIFIRSLNNYMYADSELLINTSNLYGHLMELNQSVFPAARVTPILMDVENPTRVTEFFNILMPVGYRMVFADVNEVPPELTGKFNYVLLDDASRAAKYPGRNILLLNEAESPAITQDGNVIGLDVPYLSYTDTLFYHGDEADDQAWKDFDSSTEAQMTVTQRNTMQWVSALMAGYLNNLDYTQADHKELENKIEVSTAPGFTLIKNSYFPYWKTEQGTLMPTSQGFMLVYTDSADNVRLDYRNPFYYKLAVFGSILGLVGAGGILLYKFGRGRIKPGIRA